jgi:hypothetical protein
MYLDYLKAGNEGLQHVAYWTDHFDDDFATATGLGWTVGQSGEVGRKGRFVYFDTEQHPGTVIELSEKSGRKGVMFERIRAAAADWEGSDPIRTAWPIPPE